MKNDLKFTAYLPVFFRAKRVDVKHVDHHDVKHVDVKHVDVKHVDGKHRGPYPLLSRVPVFSFIVEHRCIITGPFRAGYLPICSSLLSAKDLLFITLQKNHVLGYSTYARSRCLLNLPSDTAHDQLWMSSPKENREG